MKNGAFGAVALLAACCTAHADMVVNLRSDKGDYIGQNLAQTLTFTSGNFSATMDASGYINLNGTGGAHSIFITLSPLHNVPGSKLAEGMCYERATRGVPQLDGRPGLDVGMDSRGCNDSMGRFRIRELTVSGTQIQTLALDFSQSCRQDGGPALFGNLRINSSVAANTPFIAAVYDVTGSMHFTATGSGIGSSAPGKAANITVTRPTLIASHASYDNEVRMYYTGPVPGQMTDGSWSLDFAAPNKALVVAGSYPNATRYPFQASNVPGLDFSYNGAGSNTLTGSFNVSSATYEPYDSLPQDFVATFIQNSEGNTANKTTGTMTYHAVFHNEGIADEIFPNGFEDGQVAPASQTSLATPCSGP